MTTTTEIRALFVKLRALTARGKQLPVGERPLEARLVAALGQRAVADGYPGSHGGGGGGRGGGTLTSVEAAVNRRVFGRAELDLVAGHAEAIGRALATIAGRLDDLDALVAEVPPTDRWCAWHRAAGHEVEAVQRPTDLAGRLDRPVDLCMDCRRYGYDHGEAPDFDATGRKLRRRVPDSRRVTAGEGLAVSDGTGPEHVGTGGRFGWQNPT